MNIKHLFFYMLLIAFSSCSKPGYEKAIAEWVQTDFHGTWTDLKFELLEVLEIEDVTVSDSLRHLNNKRLLQQNTFVGSAQCVVLLRMDHSRSPSGIVGLDLLHTL